MPFDFVLGKTAEILANALAPAMLKSFADRLLPGSNRAFTALTRLTAVEILDQMQASIQQHLVGVGQWAEQFQFFGMAQPLLIDRSTIALSIYTQPRRFQLVGGQTATVGEEDLSSLGGHVLLLGAPGSGKTTTLKRIALRMLSTEPTNRQDMCQFPLVIRLRELESKETLKERIADILGLQRVSLSDEGRTLLAKASEARPGPYLSLGQADLRTSVIKCLEELGVLLVLDGLDELPAAQGEMITQEVVDLGRHLVGAKMIISSRSGTYTRQMDGFTVYELGSLTPKQVRAIAEIWLSSKAASFLKNLKKFPYLDVADRPLLLTQLIFIHQRFGLLPEQPTDVYTRLVSLLLKDWDEQQGIIRLSKYSGFDSEKKARFLASIAYQLMYAQGKVQFNSHDLEIAYREVAEGFGLPAGEASQVAQEIQTHSGIIALGPKDVYEFCHLSLQEYFCAQYLCRAFVDAPSIRYVSRYMAPIAVAVALASTPSKWFGTLVVSNSNFRDLEPSQVARFLSRLITERPAFTPAEEMGFAMLYLYQRYGARQEVVEALDRLLEMANTRRSIARSLRWYRQQQQQPYSPDFVSVILDRSLSNPFTFQLPARGLVPTRVLRDIKNLQEEVVS